MKGDAARHVHRLPALYWNWVRSEAEVRGSDGCSGVTGAAVDCCLCHDLSYRTGRDPQHAYFKFRTGAIDPFLVADLITRQEADRRFRQCLCNRSCLGNYSPFAWWRWVGVRLFARGAWERHRSNDEPAAV